MAQHTVTVLVTVEAANRALALAATDDWIASASGEAMTCGDLVYVAVPEHDDRPYDENARRAAAEDE